MVAGVRIPTLAAGLSTPEDFDAGITDLMRTAEADGVFSYTLYKSVAVATGTQQADRPARDEKHLPGEVLAAA